jgi:hypothetical protein
MYTHARGFTVEIAVYSDSAPKEKSCAQSNSDLSGLAQHHIDESITTCGPVQAWKTSVGVCAA